MDQGMMQANRVMKHFDNMGLKYTDLVDEESSVIRLNFGGSNFNTSITEFLIFDADGESMSIRVPTLAHVPENKTAAALLVCNDANRQFRWASVYLDKDNDVAVQMDAIIDDRNAGDVAAEAAQRIASIADDVYPLVMKAIWA